MKTLATSVAVAVLAVSALSLAFQKTVKVTLAELAKGQAKYDGKTIEVSGTAKGFKQKTSKAGNKYFTLKLRDGDAEINVYSRGEYGKELKDDAKLEVTGIYRIENKVAGIIFKNEIDCSKAEGKPYGIKEVK